MIRSVFVRLAQPWSSSITTIIMDPSLPPTVPNKVQVQLGTCPHLALTLMKCSDVSRRWLLCEKQEKRHGGHGVAVIGNNIRSTARF